MEGSLPPSRKANLCHVINMEPKQIGEGLRYELTEYKQELFEHNCGYSNGSNMICCSVKLLLGVLVCTEFTL